MRAVARWLIRTRRPGKNRAVKWAASAQWLPAVTLIGRGVSHNSSDSAVRLTPSQCPEQQKLCARQWAPLLVGKQTEYGDLALAADIDFAIGNRRHGEFYGGTCRASSTAWAAVEQSADVGSVIGIQNGRS